MQWQHKEIHFLVVSYIAVITGTATGSYEEGSYSTGRNINREELQPKNTQIIYKGCAVVLIMDILKC